MAEDLSAPANVATEELKELFFPSRLAQDKDVDDFKNRHKELLSAIENLEGNKYFDENVFKELGIQTLKDLLADSSNQITENNKIYHTIAELTMDAARIMEEYQSIVQPNHYFAHSELENFNSSYNQIKEKVDLVFPKYALFVTDENTKQLPDIVQKVEDERKEHNRLFVQRELEDNRQYFDYVLGTYPLDPQQSGHLPDALGAEQRQQLRL